MTIDGVRVLAQEVMVETPNFVWVITGILVVCFFGFAMLAYGFDCQWAAIISIISGISVFLWLIIAVACGVFNKPSGRNTYKCIFEENVSIQEIYDKYEVVGRDGEIWILEDKE